MIEQFRTLWFDVANDELRPPAGRARGKVALWSLKRAVAVLKGGSRSALRIADDASQPPTPHEHSLLLIVDAIAHNDVDLARRHAGWLMRSSQVDALIRSLTPLAQNATYLRAAA